MEPIVATSPPATPFTSQVTVVVVEVEESVNVTTAVKVVVVFRGTVIDVGVIATVLTVVVLLFPPQLESAVAARTVSPAIENSRANPRGVRRDSGRRRSPKVEM
jgi:hypothetical protein